MIRLFVGCDGTNSDLESQAVLEWTVRKHATQPVSITWMQQAANGPWSGWHCDTGRTTFTHFRWSIPAVCEYDGRAIYTDSDFIFLADIAELWRQPIPNVLLSKSGKSGGLGKSCCMVFDCEAAKGHVPNLERLKQLPDPQATVTGYFRNRPWLCDRFNGDWNCLDNKGLSSYESLSDSRLKAIHYTDMSTQMHLPYAVARLKAEGRTHWYTGPTRPHPRADLQALFDRELAEAIAHGYTPERYRVTPYSHTTRRNFVYKRDRRTA